MPTAVDVAVIGAGPKGLAAALKLSKTTNLSTLVIDVHGPGANWRENRMNPRLPINMRGWDVVDDDNYTFAAFWKEAGNTYKIRKNNPPLKGAYTAAHYRYYLEWLAKHVRCETGLVTDIDYDAAVDRFVVATRHAGKTQHFTAHSVIMSTGLVGYGGTEFTYDVTGLRGKTPHVRHMPNDLRTERPALAFLEGAKEIAVIGGGNSAASIFWIILKAPWIEKIHLITSMDLRFESARDLNIPPFNYQRIVEERRGIHHQNTKVMSARLEGEKVVLDTDIAGTLKVDRVVVTTGYRYDFTQIPFAKRLIRKGVFGVNDRFAKLNEHYQIVGSNGSTHAYVLGEGASCFGVDHRILPSAPAAIQIIRAALLAGFGESTTSKF